MSETDLRHESWPIETVRNTAIGSPPLVPSIDWNPPISRLAEAGIDLGRGFRRSWMWTRLAYQDIKLRYRGSIIGPFWLTISNIILISSMGVIYAEIFHTDLHSYLPFLMIGLVTWQFISTMITDGCNTFLAAQDVIQQVPLPFSIQAYRIVYRNLLTLAHTAVVIPFGLVIFQVPFGWRVVEVVPALVVLCVNGVWISVFFGIISARFRDVPPIVASFVQVLFFLTPIFWQLETANALRDYLVWNPLFAAVDVVRAPLLDAPTNSHSWPLLLASTILGSALTLVVFARFRERIAYWI